MALKLPSIFKGSRSGTLITGINVKLHGFMHSLNGMEVKEKTFTFELPFKNKTHEDMLTEATEFKAQKAEPISIKSVQVADPFKLISVDPKPPITIDSDQSIRFKFTIEAPEHGYTGPMNITLGSDSAELVHIEISKTVIEAKGRKIPIETSSRIINIPKGQIFTEKLQLYKGFSYGDTISSMEIYAPFKFVGSDPKLPIKIDDPNSYIVNIYIQAPDSPYAGIMEIKMG